MVEFFLFCIAVVGMTSIIVQGVIFLPFRQFIGDWAERVRIHREQKAQAEKRVPRRSLIEWFNEMINCAQCAGFWCGLFCGLFLLTSDKFLLNPNPQVWYDSLWRQFEDIYLDNLLGWNRLLMLFCCGLGGSFLASLGCNLVDWVFYHKMTALRHLEEQDFILAQRQAELLEEQTEPQA